MKFQHYKSTMMKIQKLKLAGVLRHANIYIKSAKNKHMSLAEVFN